MRQVKNKQGLIFLIPDEDVSIVGTEGKVRCYDKPPPKTGCHVDKLGEKGVVFTCYGKGQPAPEPRKFVGTYLELIPE